MEKVTQQDRVEAANKMANDTHPKVIKLRQKILAGNADDHPAVRAIADNRELARLTPAERIALATRLGVG